MAQLAFFGSQVFAVLLVGRDDEGYLFRYFNAEAFQTHNFPGVVGQQAELVRSQVMQDLGADAVVAQVVRIAELEVGLHGVQPLLLELVGMEFCRQANAAALLPEVEQHAAFLRNAAHGGMELAAAVAAAGAEDVPGKAFAVHAHQRGLVRGDFPVHQGQVKGSVQMGFVKMAGEFSVVRRHFDGFHQAYLLFLGPAVFNELGHGAGFQSMFFLEAAQVPRAGHGAVFLHDFTAHAGRLEARHAHKVNGGFRVAGAAQHPAGNGAQREGVAGLHEVVDGGPGIRQRADGQGTFRGADARGDVMGRVYGDGEGRGHVFPVDGGHERELESVRAFRGKRGADKAPGVGDHEVDGFRSGELGGNDEVRFVFTAGIVRDDDHPSLPDFFHGFVNSAELKLIVHMRE